MKIIRFYSAKQCGPMKIRFKTYFRFYSVEPSGPIEDPGFQKATLWFDNIFPYHLPLWDPRSYFIKSYAKAFSSKPKFTSLFPKKFPEGSEFVPYQFSFLILGLYPI